MSKTTIPTGGITDATIATADIAADAITGAKIVDDAINSEHFTNGSIDTAHIADSAVTIAKASGFGKIGQVVESTSIDTTAISSTSFSDIDLNVAITPTATSSKILLMIDFAYTQDGADNNLGKIQMLRDSTAIGNHHVGYDNPGGNVGFGCHIQKLDSPSTTSEITYKTQANTANASSQFRPVGSASIIAIEVLA